MLADYEEDQRSPLGCHELLACTHGPKQTSPKEVFVAIILFPPPIIVSQEKIAENIVFAFKSGKSNSKYSHITEIKSVREKIPKDNILFIENNYSYHGLIANIMIQLLSYELALKFEINPDYPRNLAKVVTVE